MCGESGGVFRALSTARNGLPIHEGSAPEFKRNESPKLGVERAASPMQPDEMFDITGAEYPAPFARVRKQQVAEKIIEPAFEPLTERHSKTVLLTIDDGVGKNAPHRLLKDVFRCALL